MPCDVAVSIARAKLKNADLLKLLTEADYRAILTAFAASKSMALLGCSHSAQWGMRAQLGAFTIRVSPEGQIDITGTSYARRDASTNKGMADDLAAFLTEGGLAALARKATEVLAQFGPTTLQEVEVDNNGTMQVARLLTLSF